MSQAPACPVCHRSMTVTGINPNMYFCERRQIYSDDLGVHLEVVDATIFVAPDGRHTLSIIEVPPYSFTMRDDEMGKKTEVRKIIPQDIVMGKARVLERHKVFEVDSLMNLPWDNKKKVLERVGIYLLFS